MIRIKSGFSRKRDTATESFKCLCATEHIDSPLKEMNENDERVEFDSKKDIGLSTQSMPNISLNSLDPMDVDDTRRDNESNELTEIAPIKSIDSYEFDVVDKCNSENSITMIDHNSDIDRRFRKHENKLKDAMNWKFDFDHNISCDRNDMTYNMKHDHLGLTTKSHPSKNTKRRPRRGGPGPTEVGICGISGSRIKHTRPTRPSRPTRPTRPTTSIRRNISSNFKNHRFKSQKVRSSRHHYQSFKSYSKRSYRDENIIRALAEHLGRTAFGSILGLLNSDFIGRKNLLFLR